MVRDMFRRYLLMSALINIGISFTFATYVMFLKRHGLNPFEINFVNFMFFSTLFFLELPTGAFADVYGRKASILLACVLETIGLTLYGFSTTVSGFIIAEIVCGIGRTFLNGAFQAWLIDTIKHHNYPERVINRLLGIERRVVFGMPLVGPIIGSYLDTIDPRLPWLFGAGVYGITTIVGFFVIKEVYRNPNEAKKMYGVVEKMRAGIAYARASSAVRFVFLVGFVNLIALQAFNMFWQPFFTELLPKGTLLGWVFTGISLSVLAGSWIAPRIFESSRNVAGTMILIQGLRGVFILAASLAATPIQGLLALYLYEACVGIYLHTRDVYLQNAIPSKDERATILSLSAVPQHLGGMIGLLASGAIANSCSIRSSWFASGTLLVLSSVLFWRYYGKNR